VGVGIRGRSKPSGVATFLNRRGSTFPRIAPNRVGREDAQLRTAIVSALRLDRWSDREYALLSAAAESSGTEGARMRNGKTIFPAKGIITVRLPTADVIRPNAVGLGLDRYRLKPPSCAI